MKIISAMSLKNLQRAESLPDDDTDLNELTDEQHDQRMVASLERFWEEQNMEMSCISDTS